MNKRKYYCCWCRCILEWNELFGPGVIFSDGLLCISAYLQPFCGFISKHKDGLILTTLTVELVLNYFNLKHLKQAIQLKLHSQPILNRLNLIINNTNIFLFSFVVDHMLATIGSTNQTLGNTDIDNCCHTSLDSPSPWRHLWATPCDIC